MAEKLHLHELKSRLFSGKEKRVKFKTNVSWHTSETARNLRKFITLVKRTKLKMWTKAGLAIVLNHSNLCIRCVSTSPSLSKKNHYEILEIPRAATPKDIRKAFLKKSKEVNDKITKMKGIRNVNKVSRIFLRFFFA